MSAITVDGDLVHYEKLGRGRPVILIHGWIGSWRYWIPLMQQIKLKYSVYAVDLFGFGDSNKDPKHYLISQQVRLLREFTEKMGIPKTALIGHGLGTLVSAEFAKLYPDKVARMMLTSMPLFDPGDLNERVPSGTRVKLEPPKSQNPLLPENQPQSASSGGAGDVDKTHPSASTASPVNEMPTIRRVSPEDRERMIAAQQERMLSDPLAQPDATIPRADVNNGNNHLLDIFEDTDLQTLLGKAFKRSESHYEKLKLDVDKTDNKVLTSSSRFYDAGRVLDDLRDLPMPMAIVHGVDDPVLPVPDEEVWNYLTLNQEEKIIPIPMSGVRHFPMLESEPYLRLVNDFLSISDISKLEIKERWRRRSR